MGVLRFHSWYIFLSPKRLSYFLSLNGTDTFNNKKVTNTGPA